MAGLNNLISNTSEQTTTLPGWFDTAQQNVATQAGGAFNTAPTPQNTVGQQAVNALSGPTNAFTQAGGTLQSIASGAANPWITDATGNVTPNTQTALGGLFQAQNQQLNQTLPTTIAPTQAGAIGSGNFGSLRGQTAVDTAKANALANLNTAQFQAALQNQATGVNAAQGAGNVGQQNINNLLTTGQYQQAAPFTNVSNYGKVLGGLQAPTTVRNQTQLSPLNQVAGLVQALGGQSGTTGILGALGVNNGLQGLISKIPGFGPSTGTSSGATQSGGALGGGTTPGTYPLAGGGSMVVSPDGSKVITQGDGTVSSYGPDGKPLGGTTNAGDVAPGGVTEQDLYNQQSGNTTYTPDQLDQYQNSYDNSAYNDAGY